MVALSVWESAETVILFVSSDFAGTVKRKFRRVPGADPAHPLTVAVSLVFHHLLNVLCPPMMKPLFLGTVFAAFKIELLHDNDMSTVINRRIHNEVGCFNGDRIVDAFRLRLESGHLAISLFLGVLDALQGTIQRVFFTAEAQEALREDSAL